MGGSTSAVPSRLLDLALPAPYPDGEGSPVAEAASWAMPWSRAKRSASTAQAPDRPQSRAGPPPTARPAPRRRLRNSARGPRRRRLHERAVDALWRTLGGSVLVMDIRTTVERAQRIKQLHAEYKPLVLPTVWDVWSARTAAGAGFPALTIGSHPLADSRGADDHEGQTFEEVLAAVRPIIAAVDVPVSVDLEAGYGQEPADLIAGLTEVGGAGLNIEDTVHSDGGRLRSTKEHANYIAGLRAAADDAGIPVWINGRTDLFLRAEDASAVLDEAIERLHALEQAGADSVYPVGIQDDDGLLTAVTGAVSIPVNSTAHPVKHDLDRFRRLGVGRITYGPLLQIALTDAMRNMIGPWAP